MRTLDKNKNRLDKFKKLVEDVRVIADNRSWRNLAKCLGYELKLADDEMLGRLESVFSGVKIDSLFGQGILFALEEVVAGYRIEKQDAESRRTLDEFIHRPGVKTILSELKVAPQGRLLIDFFANSGRDGII